MAAAKARDPAQEPGQASEPPRPEPEQVWVLHDGPSAPPPPTPPTPPPGYSPVAWMLYLVAQHLIWLITALRNGARRQN